MEEAESKAKQAFPIGLIGSDKVYYGATIGSDDGVNWWIETQTCWVGFADDSRKIELRKARTVDPVKLGTSWKTLGQPFSIVNDDRSYASWILSGGHALVVAEQMAKHLPDQLEPTESVCEGAIGFTSAEQLPRNAFQKAPTPKLRMTVLKRDKYRCVICGQRPAEDVNIQLQVHHIRPFASRGVTTERNLITLCHTCHGGLEPHYEFGLFALITKKSENEDVAGIMLREYVNSVTSYRKMIFGLLANQA